MEGQDDLPAMPPVAVWARRGGGAKANALRHSRQTDVDGRTESLLNAHSKDIPIMPMGSKY
jgi:hypothetical protein